MATYGFHPTEWDPCVFKRVRADGHFYFLGVYVDDTIHVYTDDAEFEELDANLKRDFLGYTDLGPLTEIFNAEVTETDTHVTLYVRLAVMVRPAASSPEIGVVDRSVSRSSASLWVATSPNTLAVSISRSFGSLCMYWNLGSVDISS